MASSSPPLDPPLAEYFWIAGIDSISYGEHLAQDQKPLRASFTEQLLEAIEAEDEATENSLTVPGMNGSRMSNGSTFLGTNGTSPPSSSRSSMALSSSPDRTSTLSFLDVLEETPRNSMLQRHDSTSSNSTITENNHSAFNGNAPPPRRPGLLDFDFDKALLKFAAERDSFLEDLSFSAGTVLPKKPLMHPKAQKVIADDQPSGVSSENTLLQKTNSLRRRISLRDLTSMRRAPSVVNRACTCTKCRPTEREPDPGIGHLC